MASPFIETPPEGVDASNLLGDSSMPNEEMGSSRSQDPDPGSQPEIEDPSGSVEKETDRLVIKGGRVVYEEEAPENSGIGYTDVVVKIESEDSLEPIDYSITANRDETKSPQGIECTVCHKILRNERTMTEHMRLHTGERPFACTECDAAFISADTLRRHRVTIHLGERPERPGPVNCSICQKELANDRTLKEHMRIHSGERPYACDVCGLSFMALDRLRRHQNTAHLGERPEPLQCTICYKELSNGHSLRRHMLVHSGERNFNCDECGKVFRTATDLNVHLKTHTGEKKYECKECGGRYIKPSDLAKHMKRKHSGANTGGEDDDMSEETTMDSIFDAIMNPELKTLSGILFPGSSAMENPAEAQRFECPICQREMANQRNLTEHMRTHTGEKPFSCMECDSTFMSADRLRRHRKNRHSDEPRIPSDRVECPICQKGFPKRKLPDHIRSHTGERPFPCDECGVSFTTFECLRRHLKSQIHSEPTERLECPVCQKDLASKRTLQEHMRTHTGEKPYLCTECGARFASKDSIRRHRRIHSGERPYECEECGKVFRDHTALKTHKTTHSGQRPHACKECGRSFLTRTQVKNHMRKAHPTLISAEGTEIDDISEETTRDSIPDTVANSERGTLFDALNGLITVNYGNTHRPSGPGENGEYGSTSGNLEPMIEVKEEETDRLVIIGGRVGYEDVAGPSGVAELLPTERITVNYEGARSPFFPEEVGHFPSTSQESEPIPTEDLENALFEPKQEETDRLVIRGGRVVYEEEAGTSEMEEDLLEDSDESKPPSGLLNEDMTASPHDFSELPDGSITDEDSLQMSGDSTSACPICFKVLASQHTLNVHMRIHDRPRSKNRPFICEKCGCGFGSKGALTRHLNQHGQIEGRKNRIRCKMCGTMFLTRTAMLYHQKTKHPGEKPPPPQRRSQMNCKVVG